MTRTFAIRAALAAVLASVLTGCALFEAPPAPQARPTFLVAPGLEAGLPASVCRGPGAGPSKALLRVEAKGTVRRLVVVTRCSEGRFAIEGLLPSGVPVFRGAYDGRLLEQKAFVPVPDGFDAAQVAGGHLLAVLPVGDWEGSLPEGCRLEATPDGRELACGGRIIERIGLFPSGAPRFIENTAFGYRIDFKPLD